MIKQFITLSFGLMLWYRRNNLPDSLHVSRTMYRENKGHSCFLNLFFFLHCQVLEFLSNPHDESRHEERQQAVLELLNTGVLDQFEETKLLTLAENAKL